jgi:hypothetical protein
MNLTIVDCGTISETLRDWQNGTLDTNKLWCGWFCRDSSLPHKSEVLLKKLSQLSTTIYFDCDKSYAVFKNSYSDTGELYDEIDIQDWDTGELFYRIIPHTTTGKSVLWGRENDFEAPLVKGAWSKVKWYFGI